MDLQEATEIIRKQGYPCSTEIYDAITVLLDFAKDYLVHRIPLRVAPHQLGEFAMEWFIQGKDGRTMLPKIPDCLNIRKLFRDMDENKPNWHFSYCPKMTEAEIKDYTEVKLK